MTNLQKMRLKANLSQSQLAKKSKVKLRTIQQYEIKNRDLSCAKLATLISLSTALDCKIKDIIDDEELIDKIEF